MSGGNIFGEELHLLRHAAFDDVIVFVQAHGQAFAIEDLFADLVFHHGLKLGGSRLAMPLRFEVHIHGAKVVEAQRNLLGRFDSAAAALHVGVRWRKAQHPAAENAAAARADQRFSRGRKELPGTRLRNESCSSGTILQKLHSFHQQLLGFRRRVPNRRRPGTLLYRGRDVRIRRQVQLGGPIRRPARRRNLEHASVIGDIRLRIEGRIGPLTNQLGRADGVLVGGGLHVNRIADGRDLAGFRIGLAVAAPHHVVNVSLLLPFLVEILMIWMRSRFPLSGSLTA